jgi:TonB-linked SusC/RagA family outer membrane protein
VAAAASDQIDPRAEATLRNAHVTVRVDNVTLSQAINAIGKSAQVRIQYRSDVVNAYTKPVTLHVVNVSLGEALDKVLTGTGLRVVPVSGGSLAIVRTLGETRVAAGGTVTGTVIDSATGKPVEGAKVSIENTTLATTTSEKGVFVLNEVPVGEQGVIVKAFGYKPVRQVVTVADGERRTIRITMSATATILSGVVTTVAGTQRKVEVGNDITTLNVDSIMRVAPITSVTDLLETRVPGLTIAHSSGTPGDPSRIRLRGASSITGNNDPIVIVDGVRVYASQSDIRNVNLAPGAIAGTDATERMINVTGGRRRVVGFSAPSPLDQIDPNTIASIEVFKGPSATALYGSDAANGVIVITTKHGRAGPTHWSVTLGQGVNWVPGNWPTTYYRFGSTLTGNTYGIPVGQCAWYDYTCAVDSIVPFQALNDPRYTVFSHGSNQNASTTVSGGTATLLYSFTGTTQTQRGNLQLPRSEQVRYSTLYGPIPYYLVHPDRYTTYGGSGSLTAQPSSMLSATWQSSLFRSDQQRSSLENAVSQLEDIYIDPANIPNSGLITNEYERATDRQLTATNGVTLRWRALPWLPINATGGFNTIQRTDETYIPYGVSYSPASDTAGAYGLGKGTSQVLTLTLGTTFPVRFMRTAVGLNYTNQSTADVSAFTSQLAPGVTRPTTFPVQAMNGQIPSYFSQATTAASTYGWYVQPKFNFNSRFFVSPGFRLDGGSASGTNAGLTGFPKIDFSYLAIDQDHPVGVITLFRPRLAVGYAGTQPNPVDKLRLFNLDGHGNLVSLDGATNVSGVTLSTLGNTHLRPERTSEIEGGFDLDVGNDRVQLTVTAYNKIRHDAIIAVPVPPSVSGTGSTTVDKNIGVVRDAGTEISIETRVLDNPLISWNINGDLSANRNKVLRLNPGQSTILVGTTRVEAGYPLWSTWAQPIVSYVDANQDGIIEANEFRLGDSAVFVGQTDPKYQLDLHTTVGLFNGRLSMTAGVQYQDGLTQTQGTAAFTNGVLWNLPNMPNTTLATQAAVLAGLGRNAGISQSSQIGVIQTVNTLRFTSLSINYILPPTVLRLFHVPTMSLALQGSNLGLHTNYRGADPNVNAFSTAGNGDALQDTGQLPEPRTWSLVVRLGN